MDNIPILNSTVNNDDENIEDMLFYNSLGLEPDGLTKIESDALDNNMVLDNEDLYEIIKFKDLIIDTLKNTNMNLTSVIFNFDDKINSVNKSINNVLSNVSTNQSINSVIKTNKNLVNQINKERETIKTLSDKLENYENELNILKTTYSSLNKIYINSFQNNSPLFLEVNKLQDKINNLKEFETELRNIKDNLKCKICYDRTINCLIEPCGHTATCLDCINHMRDITPLEEIKCPICNGIISNCKNIYLPV